MIRYIIGVMTIAVLIGLITTSNCKEIITKKDTKIAQLEEKIYWLENTEDKILTELNTLNEVIRQNESL